MSQTVYLGKKQQINWLQRDCFVFTWLCKYDGAESKSKVNTGRYLSTFK